jgi:hypothetical protein
MDETNHSFGRFEKFVVRRTVHVPDIVPITVGTGEITVRNTV